MARNGITYQAVADAAAQLVAAGKGPTVDAVRALLGTGSKGTITPMLRRWKQEHDEKVQAPTGLPGELLSAVTGLYQGMQERAEAEIQRIQTEAETEIGHAKEAAQLAEEARRLIAIELEGCSATRDALAEENRQLVATLAGLQQERAVQQLQLEAQRGQLEERGRAYAELREQLARSQENLEHYRESVRAQREEERADTERQRLAFEEQARRTRTELLALQAEQRELLISQAKLQTAHSHLEVALAAATQREAELAEVVTNARHQLAQREGELGLLNRRQTELEGTLQGLSQRAQGCELQLAVSDKERTDSAAALVDCRTEGKQALAENRRLTEECHRLAATCERLEQLLKAADS